MILIIHYFLINVLSFFKALFSLSSPFPIRLNISVILYVKFNSPFNMNILCPFPTVLSPLSWPYFLSLIFTHSRPVPVHSYMLYMNAYSKSFSLLLSFSFSTSTIVNLCTFYSLLLNDNITIFSLERKETRKSQN